MPEESGGEKTLPASPRKRQRARERGNVAKSQDLNSAWAMLVALGTLWLIGPTMLERMCDSTRYYFRFAAQLPVAPETMPQTMLVAVVHLVRIVLPFFIAMVVAGLSINIMQVGFLVAPQALEPKFNKLNPFTGLSKFFSIRSFVELLKSLAKLIVTSYVVYLTMRSRWENFMALASLTPIAIVHGVAGLVAVIWFRVALVMLSLGLLDYAFQRWQHEQDLKMTVKEAQEEMKELEGDPRIRQRVRQIQRQMAMQRMMKDVPTADVVITNPTTYAVALRYDMEEMDAPTLTAKGARLVAQRIRELAVEHNVPVVERPELARAIFRTVEVGHPVSEDLYQAVADVLKFVYEIDRRAEKVQERQAFLQSLGRPAVV